MYLCRKDSVMKACVKVEWIDSCASNNEWILGSDVDKWDNIEPIKIFTYGILIKEDKDYIVVSQNYGIDPEQYCNLMSIPRGCVVKVSKMDDID